VPERVRPLFGEALSGPRLCEDFLPFEMVHLREDSLFFPHFPVSLEKSFRFFPADSVQQVSTAVFSLSFLPWVLFLLAIVISIPVASFVDNRRRAKMVNAAASQKQEEAPAATIEEGISETDGGFGSFGAAPLDDDPFK